MAVDTTSIPKGKLVIRNIGLLLSGDIDQPIRMPTRWSRSTV